VIDKPAGSQLACTLTGGGGGPDGPPTVVCDVTE